MWGCLCVNAQCDIWAHSRFFFFKWWMTIRKCIDNGNYRRSLPLGQLVVWHIDFGRNRYELVSISQAPQPPFALNAIHKLLSPPINVPAFCYPSIRSKQYLFDHFLIQLRSFDCKCVLECDSYNCRPMYILLIWKFCLHILWSETFENGQHTKLKLNTSKERQRNQLLFHFHIYLFIQFTIICSIDFVAHFEHFSDFSITFTNGKIVWARMSISLILHAILA